MKIKGKKKVKDEKLGSGKNENEVGIGKIRGNDFFFKKPFRDRHYLRERGKRGNIARALEILDRAGSDEPPRKGDEVELR